MYLEDPAGGVYQKCCDNLHKQFQRYSPGHTNSKINDFISAFKHFIGNVLLILVGDKVSGSSLENSRLLGTHGIHSNKTHVWTMKMVDYFEIEATVGRRSNVKI